VRALHRHRTVLAILFVAVTAAGSHGIVRAAADAAPIPATSSAPAPTPVGATPPTASRTVVRAAAGVADDTGGPRPAPPRRRTVRPAPPQLPPAARWSLPPVMVVRATRAAPPGTARRLLDPHGAARLAPAPTVLRALRRGADPRALAGVLAAPANRSGPLLVLALDGRTARVQAVSLEDTLRTLRALAALPRAVRPTVLLEAAAADRADVAGPPAPRAGELASLVPVYQAAGRRWGVDWRVLAAINLVETDLGRNAGVSSAGAVGWMQFMPATWRAYGTDASGDGVADPHDPTDAIHSAARYLDAAGFRRDPAGAIWAYNHADWYVRQVVALSRALPAPFDRLD
jgi:soluble lytic murein transglycosylase-like protein